MDLWTKEEVPDMDLSVVEKSVRHGLDGNERVSDMGWTTKKRAS